MHNIGYNRYIFLKIKDKNLSMHYSINFVITAPLAAQIEKITISMSNLDS